MHKIIQTITLLLIIILILSTTTAKPRKDWSKVNFDTIEEEWKTGDDERDLLTPDEEFHRETERRRREAQTKLHNAIKEEKSEMEIQKLMKEVQNAGRPAMIFTKLRMDSPKKKKDGWDWDSLAMICEEWQYRLDYINIKVKCYPMEPNGILVTVQRGWFGNDVFEFLSKQQDILTEVKWNDVVVNPSDERSDEF